MGRAWRKEAARRSSGRGDPNCSAPKSVWGPFEQAADVCPIVLVAEYPPDTLPAIAGVIWAICARAPSLHHAARYFQDRRADRDHDRLRKVGHDLFLGDGRPRARASRKARPARLREYFDFSPDCFGYVRIKP